MMTLRQRLSLIANQAEAENNTFVTSAVREAMNSLATYDQRVTDLLRANSDSVDRRRTAEADAGAMMMLMWLIVDATGTRTIERNRIQAYPGPGVADLVIETNKVSGDVVIVARTKPQQEAANG